MVIQLLIARYVNPCTCGSADDIKAVCNNTDRAGGSAKVAKVLAFASFRLKTKNI